MTITKDSHGTPNIMIFCSEYLPEPGSTGVMIAQLAKALVTDGFAVTVLTGFPNRPGGRLYSGYTRRLRAIENDAGVRVIRCPAWLLGPKRHYRDRVLENITYGLSALLNSLWEPEPDLIIVETWPILASHLSFLRGAVRRVPIVYYVQDVYPEIAIDTGLLSEKGLAAKALLALDSNLIRRASSVIAISETMKELLCSSRRIGNDKVHIIYNWVKEEDIFPALRSNAWRRALGIPEDTFILTFAGTVGLVSGADMMIDMAHNLHYERVHLLCIGEGPLKPGMVERAQRDNLTNLSFLDFQSEADFPLMLAASDAFFLPMRPGTRDASVPSKLISYLAAGRPVISSTPLGAATREIVVGNNAGIASDAGDVSSVVDAALTLANNPSLSKQLGDNARRAYEQLFTFRRSYAEFRSLIDRHLRRADYRLPLECSPTQNRAE